MRRNSAKTNKIVVATIAVFLLVGVVVATSTMGSAQARHWTWHVPYGTSWHYHGPASDVPDVHCGFASIDASGQC